MKEPNKTTTKATKAEQERVTPQWVIVVCSLAAMFFTAEVVLYMLFPGFAHNEPWQGLHITAAARILDNKALYPELSTEESYYAYSPLLPWIHALFLKVFGIGTFSVKVSALLSCIANILGIYSISRIMGAEKKSIFVVIAFFLSFYPVLGFWFLSVRPDNISSAFVVWATVTGYQAEKSKNLAWPILAGVLLAASALCKQTFGIMGICFFCYFLWKRQFRIALSGFMTWSALGLIFLVVYNTGEEHFLSTIKMMSAQSIHMPTHNMPYFLIALLLIPLSITLVNFRTLGLLGPMIVGSFVMGVIGISKWGGWSNGFFTLIVLCTPVLAWAMIMESRQNYFTRFVAVAIGMVVLLYLPRSIERIINWDKHHPDYLANARQFIVQKQDKKIYFPRRNYLTYILADQYYHCDWMTENLIHAGMPAPKIILTQIRAGSFDYIVGELTTKDMKSFVSQFYKRAKVSGIENIEIYVPR